MLTSVPHELTHVENKKKCFSNSISSPVRNFVHRQRNFHRVQFHEMVPSVGIGTRIVLVQFCDLITIIAEQLFPPLGK